MRRAYALCIFVYGVIIMDRVKVSYAVDLDDVPKVADYIYEEAIGDLQKVLSMMQGVIFSEQSIPVLSEKVRQIRTSLARIDQRIDDCYAITAGYHSSIIEPEGTVASTVQGLPEEQHAQVMNLSGKIAALQRAMAGSEDDGQ